MFNKNIFFFSSSQLESEALSGQDFLVHLFNLHSYHLALGSIYRNWKMHLIIRVEIFLRTHFLSEGMNKTFSLFGKTMILRLKYALPNLICLSLSNVFNRKPPYSSVVMLLEYVEKSQIILFSLNLRDIITY